MKKNWRIPRRHFLRGLGATMALPLLDVMGTSRALAATTGGGAVRHPVRMAFLFVPNGVHMPDWTPTQRGDYFDLPYILDPLAPVKDELLILSGLTHDKGRANGDGPGDHARSASVFLTGAQPLKSEGSQIRSGVSVDQRAAAELGGQTRFASLELGTERGRQSGKCDSGYSCAYSNNISWRNEATPMTKETNPRAVFERLFRGGTSREVAESRAKRKRYEKSILDFVLEDARQLAGRVGGADRMKLDEYLTAVREIEQRIERAETSTDRQLAAISDYNQPAGIPDSYEEHIRLMNDMLVLAFQSDVTRVATYMLANAGSNRNYPFIGVNEGHHSLSHHQDDPAKHAKIREINRFHVRQFSHLLQRLRSIPEGAGTLLDHCMIVYGSGISDGNRHNNENLPVLMAGSGGGAIAPGRHIAYDRETPMCNLFLSMLNRAGVEASSIGDSTAELRGLDG